MELELQNHLLELREKCEGLASPGETLELYEAVINTPAGAVIEIGSASGGTTIALILAAKTMGKMVYSVDPYPKELEGIACHYPVGLMDELKEKFRVNILSGEHDNIIQYTEHLHQCIDRIPMEISVAFIDGLHEYDNAMNEFALLYPRIVSGGWVYIHDTCWDTGQLHGTPETGLINVLTKIDKSLFTETKIFGSMFCGRK